MTTARALWTLVVTTPTPDGIGTAYLTGAAACSTTLDAVLGQTSLSHRPMPSSDIEALVCGVPDHPGPRWISPGGGRVGL